MNYCLNYLVFNTLIIDTASRTFPVNIGMFLNKEMISKVISLSIAVFVFFFCLFIFSRLFRLISNKIEKLKINFLKPVVVRGNTIISEDSLARGILFLAKSIRLILTFILVYSLYTYIIYVFNINLSGKILEVIKGGLLTIFTIIVTVAFLKSVQIFFKYLRKNLLTWTESIIKPISFKGLELISVDRISRIILKSTIPLQFITVALVLYFMIPVVFSFFDYTRSWSVLLFGYIVRPLKVMVFSFINYLPNLFFVAVIVIVNRYVIKILKMVFHEIERGTISLPNFHRDWAVPTYKIVRFMVIIFTLIIAFPYLPGSQSDAFKGVSIFLGVLLSLGSTAVIANVVAGTILTYMFAFKLGDRVKIGDTVGDVIEKTLLVTRIKTPKNVIITIPNSTVLNSHIINYSSSARKDGLILHTTITLGYDVPWRKVHDVLKDAAQRTENIDKEKAPFVLQTALGDFAVSYELNAYTEIPEKMSQIYSDLHHNIQDTCNEAGIEILSPHFSAIRDGNKSTMPEEYLEDNYTPQFYRFFTDKK